jgi:predicted unusual protein kinase regulating ubiquinone biosynthesis (AarF/ABC1/UbiB family)
MAGPRPSATQRAYRARRIGLTFGRVYLGIRANRFLARRVRPPDMPERWRRFHRRSARTIYDAAIELQGLILKGCQFLGSRADVLPREYVDVLSKLQDRVPPRPFAVVKEAVERELGAELAQVFRSFESIPVASASLAQVHAAELQSGERVAVKVQYPEIERLVKSDLANVRTLFRAVGLFEGDLDLMPLVDELAEHVPRELNFVNEGHNAEAIGRHFKGREDVGVPRIHWAFTTRRVLVMEYVDGIKITDLEGLREAGLDRARISQLLVEAYCEQILNQGFFHADPHPGNLLVQRLASGQPRLVFLDFGLAKELPPRFRQGAMDFAAALLRGEPEAMAEALLALGFETRDGRPEGLLEIARFVLEVGQRFRHGVRLEGEIGERFGREIPDRIRENPIVRIPTHLVLLGRVIGLLSGVNRSLDARIDLARTIFPYVAGVRRSV